MKVDLSYKESLDAIVADISKIPYLTKQKERKLYRGMGSIISQNVKKMLSRSHIKNAVNYDGTKPYVHMADDIKVETKSANGTIGVIVGGGKKTAFKWHLLDDGTVNPDGTTHTQATHFTQKALVASEHDIDKLIDEVIAEVANGR